MSRVTTPKPDKSHEQILAYMVYGGTGLIFHLARRWVAGPVLAVVINSWIGGLGIRFRRRLQISNISLS
jgi:hypothetical protein